MQKGDSAKLKLLLAGISARLTKNRDFFVQADCTLVSGKKKFDAKLSRADEDYTLHFQGSDRRVDAAEFAPSLPSRLRNTTRACSPIPSAARSLRCP